LGLVLIFQTVPVNVDKFYFPDAILYLKEETEVVNPIPHNVDEPQSKHFLSVILGSSTLHA
jgi:hypothetical protein